MGGETIPVARWDDLVNIVSSTPAGKILQLRIVRQGREVKVSLPLNAKPLVAADPTKQVEARQWLNQRSEEGEQYWNTNFAELDGGVISRVSGVIRRRAPSNTAHQA